MDIIENLRFRWRGEKPQRRNFDLDQKPITAGGRVISSREMEKFLNPESIIKIAQYGRPALDKRIASQKLETPEGYSINIEGDDARTFNEETGVAVVADGVSTGEKSGEMSRQAARGLRWMLENISNDLPEAEWESWLNSEISNRLLDLIKTERHGGVMVLAGRYLPESDELLVIDIGNCQLAINNGRETFNLKTEEEMENAAAKDPRWKKTDLIMIKQLLNEDPKISDQRKNPKPLVYRIKLARYRQPGRPLKILMGSDGYQESTGRHLADIKSPDDLDLSKIEAADDISILELEIPKK